jgi:hypothetical protein
VTLEMPPGVTTATSTLPCDQRVGGRQVIFVVETVTMSEASRSPKVTVVT